MRSRLAALLILISLLAVPAWLYWYFFVSQVASVMISVPPWIPYRVLLAGTLDNKALPLADKLIRIERDCIWNCLLSPIAPIWYTLTLTSPGQRTITDDITLVTWESKSLSYVFQWESLIEPSPESPTGNSDIGLSIVSNATQKDPAFEYRLVGVSWSGDIVYAERRSTVTRELGTLSLEKFIPQWKIPKWVADITLDITGEYLIAPIFSDKTLILARDLSWQKEIPIQGVIWYSRGITDDKILTNSGVITSWHGSYGENPRFTDSLDISLTERLWYISADDSEKLTLSNLPSWESVLLILDRTTGKTEIIKRWIDIRFLFFSQGFLVFLDKEGKMWSISNN
jgi:hypothetical protein